jgi:hypothetical protein
MLILLAVALLQIPTIAGAGIDCNTRKSGSVTVTTCTDSKANACRSYMSGSVRKTADALTPSA